MDTLFPASDTHTYKVVATRTSGKQAIYNYISSIKLAGEFYVLEGRDQPDDQGTMEKRSFVLLAKGHGELDVRQISSVRSMPASQRATVNAEESAEELINF